MHRALTLVAALFFWSGIAHATIALVQAPTPVNGATAVTETASFSATIAAGDVTGVFVVTNSQTSAAPSSVVDSESDTLITPIAWTQTGGFSAALYLFVASTTSSSYSITVNFAAGTTFTMTPFAYSGVNQTTPLDVADVIHNGSSITASSGSLTPSQVGDQQLGFEAGGAVSSWGTGLTGESSYTSLPPHAAFADGNLATTSAVTATATLSASASWIATQILLAPSGGSPSCTHDGYTSSGTLAIPNGTSGSYWLKNGTFGVPDCSTVDYWQPAVGNFGMN